MSLQLVICQQPKLFFAQVFGWSFQDFGSAYAAFSSPSLQGGFYQSHLCSKVNHGGALVVFYSKDLEHTQQKIEKVHGKIVKSIFTFPGGRRFHFSEPSGNEFAVWSA